jgi:hypothetical protein
VEFLDIKKDFERTRSEITSAISYSEKQIAKVEAVSAEMHSAGRHLKNIGRTVTGKEMIPDVKPNGKLAKLLEAPYRSQLRSLKNSLNRVNKSLNRLDKLEKSATLRRERSRPSTLEHMERLKEVIAERARNAPVVERVKTAGAEI